VKLVREHAGDKCSIMLVATKADLIESDGFGKVMAQAEALQTEIKSDGVFVTSAKTGQSIEELFMTTAGFHPMFHAEKIVDQGHSEPVPNTAQKSNCC
jgi:predicted GTPase